MWKNFPYRTSRGRCSIEAHLDRGCFVVHYLRHEHRRKDILDLEVTVSGRAREASRECAACRLLCGAPLTPIRSLSTGASSSWG